ncbi:MAG TPA: helix-turn-helix transcriptional regulator [Thermoanaerobaculia bacterium]|nr:helix-turn-helix transcriptional regulator [Thermoanaerobaculia bacterium]
MKQGEVLMKERERRKISAEEMAGKVGLPLDRYLEIEAGNSPAERWGPAIRDLAVALQVPTSRMFATSGKSADTKPGQAAELIRGHREAHKLSAADVAGKMGITPEEYDQVESGGSEIEEWGPFFLRFAESLENGFPVFNLFHPFGLPFEKLSLEDYR